ncbi:MarR family transcriptional regulator [Jatrophihabitans sp. DSM 45814]
MITFGPELIGRTEKTLGALLRRNLADTGLDEQQYVTLKVASTLTTSEDLTEAVRGRAHFADAAQIVTGLTDEGLLSDGRLSPAGSTLLDQILASAAAQSQTIWTEIPEADVAATARVLNTLLARAEAVLAH